MPLIQSLFISDQTYNALMAATGGNHDTIEDVLEAGLAVLFPPAVAQADAPIPAPLAPSLDTPLAPSPDTPLPTPVPAQVSGEVLQAILNDPAALQLIAAAIATLPAPVAI